jgi:hypothetical protein
MEAPGNYVIVDPVVPWSSAIIAAALCIGGGVAWSSRSQAVAWVLLLLLSAEIGARAIGA